MNNKKRIFIGPVDIGGYYSYIAKELDKQGYKVSLFYNSNNIYQPDIYKNANDSWFLNRLFYGPQKKNNSKIGLLNKLLWIIIRGILTPFILSWAILKHDIFIFSFGYTFIPGCIDLWLFKKMGKRIISNIAHGSDSRPPYIDGSVIPDDDISLLLSSIRKITLFTQKKVNRIERFSDVVICAPYSCQFLSKKFVNSFALGIPMKKATTSIDNHSEDKIRILHAPSHLSAKGTIYIREAIENLKNKGYKINYIELKNVPHSKVLEELAYCDFVIDQVFSDTPLAGFAAEAAYYGKAAVVGGYGLEELRYLIPKDMFPPSQICHPDNLEKAIEQLIMDENYRIQLGIAAQIFVKALWTPEFVAQRFIKILNNTITETWFLNPTEIVYLNGAGLQKKKSIQIVNQMINKYGIASLQLKNKHLESAFKTFAQDINH